MSPIPLSLEHNARISNLCSALQIPLSEYNFANLYLFRTIHQYQLLSLSRENLAIVGVSYNHKTFLMPLFRPHDWSACVREAQQLKVDFIFPIPEMWFDEVRLQGHFLSFQDMDSDYVYEAESIKQYKGRHFDGQRNAIRRLRADHDLTVVKLHAATRTTALRVIDEWEKEHTTEPQHYEARACREAIQMAEALQLEGWIFMVDGYPRSLLIGAPLTHDTYCFHFEKSCLSFRGLPAYMFQTIAQELDSKYLYLNWEQDLGDRGLMQAKASYRPLRKALKGRLIVHNKDVAKKTAALYT